ncbi:snRNA-activating protein complex subunit 3 [Culicoides brevitarsis]|uniref:snRNA-activating protein complex subunit 3 n=1 Tax=Culicoides brevitarsis TaxID=469753 RepID=UPI00307C2C6A
MDHIYKPPIKSTEPFELQKWQEFQRKINPFHTSNAPLDVICGLNTDKVGYISAQTIENVMNSCQKEISEPYFLHKIKEVPIPEAAKGLKCVRRALTNQKRSRSFSERIQRATMIQLPPNEVKGLSTAKSYNDTVFVVKVFEPFKYVTGARKTPKVGQEIRLLGSHKLTMLRDNIRCYDAPLLDISGDPNQELPAECHNSSFIFIDDTFYNDCRNPQNLDYSEVLRDWAEKKRKNDFRHLKQDQMENISMQELKFKVGFPYFYQHFGNCEHLLIFTDVRVVTRREVNQRIGFPMVLNGSTKHVYCFICGLNEALFVIQGSTEHIQDPSQICDHCLLTLHYKDGKKIGNFSLYRINKDPNKN